MSKVQKDRLLSLSIKEKKLIRLLYTNELNDADYFFLNRLYEEKQKFSLKYIIKAFPTLLTLGANQMLFRTNSRWLQVSFCMMLGGFMHLSIRNIINQRFYSLVNPYFEKYTIN